jgi:hypothetical protein
VEGIDLNEVKGKEGRSGRFSSLPLYSILHSTSLFHSFQSFSRSISFSISSKLKYITLLSFLRFAQNISFSIYNGNSQVKKKMRAVFHSSLVPEMGLEPTQPSLAKGFSYHYDFRHHISMFVVWNHS